MADAFRVDVGDRAQKLVRVDLDEQIWHHLFYFQVLFHHSVGSIRNVVHDDIKINLLWLVAIGVKGLSHLDAIRMVKHFKDL